MSKYKLGDRILVVADEAFNGATGEIILVRPSTSLCSYPYEVEFDDPQGEYCDIYEEDFNDNEIELIKPPLKVYTFDGEEYV